MIRCATMQSTLLRYLSSKYYYSILCKMMMPKEGMVCFIVFFNKKNIWFDEKIKSISIIEKVMIILLILGRPF